jgi:hypothetical protein
MRCRTRVTKTWLFVDSFASLSKLLPSFKLVGMKHLVLLLVKTRLILYLGRPRLEEPVAPVWRSLVVEELVQKLEAVRPRRRRPHLQATRKVKCYCTCTFVLRSSSCFLLTPGSLKLHN